MFQQTDVVSFGGRYIAFMNSTTIRRLQYAIVKYNSDTVETNVERPFLPATTLDSSAFWRGSQCIAGNA
jgi:hypothetical protein